MPEPTCACQSQSVEFRTDIVKPTVAHVVLQPVSTDQGPHPQSLAEPQYVPSRRSNARNHAPDTSGKAVLRAWIAVRNCARRQAPWVAAAAAALPDGSARDASTSDTM